jgi:hypothetical protein
MAVKSQKEVVSFGNAAINGLPTCEFIDYMAKYFDKIAGKGKRLSKSRREFSLFLYSQREPFL